MYEYKKLKQWKNLIDYLLIIDFFYNNNNNNNNNLYS